MSTFGQADIDPDGWTSAIPRRGADQRSGAHRLASPTLRQAPSPPDDLVEAPVTTDREARPGGGRYCAMCKKIHGAKPQVELAA
jgi:hypothetical protein